MEIVLIDYILILGWIIALSIIMGVAVPLLIWIMDKLTGQVNIWQELKKTNIALAILLGSVVLGFCIIIGMSA